MYQRQVSFTEAIQRALGPNYCNFSGRASRSEYWWFYLFSLLLSWAVAIVFCWSDTMESIMTSLVGLALLLPSLGLGVRRLHDIGKSGWWLLLAFLPIVGWIILIVWFCQNSQMHDNFWGPVPNMVY